MARMARIAGAPSLREKLDWNPTKWGGGKSVSGEALEPDGD
jgi:hypothetical protein